MTVALADPLAPLDPSLNAWDSFWPAARSLYLDEDAETGRMADPDAVLIIEPPVTDDMGALAALLRPLAIGQPSLLERWAGDPDALLALHREPTRACACRGLLWRGLCVELGLGQHPTDADMAAALGARLGIAGGRA